MTKLFSIKNGLVLGRELPMNETIDKPINTSCFGESCYEVVATVGKRVEGVPVVILEDKEPFNQAINYAEKTFGNATEDNHTQFDSAMNGYVAGYKAAQSKGCYTVEDMKKAFQLGLSYEYNMERPPSEDDPKRFINLLAFIELKKEPVSVELEIVKEIIDGLCEGDGLEMEFLKITNPYDNSITPVSVNYK